jgi:adenine deaminase
LQQNQHVNMGTTAQTFTANYVDVIQGSIYPASIEVANGKIKGITALEEEKPDSYILPGFIDAHVHVESSMLVPSEFARLAVRSGTIGTVSDPHEIANVLGTEGVEYMIENGEQVPFYFNFGAPSCVPATTFETAGAELDAQDVEDLLRRKDIKYLSEMMNYPGVLDHDDEVWRKLMAAKKFQKPIDGHAPGVMGEDARLYVESGISTDHECSTKDEALDKLRYGMNIIIREGSAAKNFEALIELLDEFPEKIMFCSDDKHPDDLVKGHIDQLLARAIHHDIDTMKAIKAATYNPVKHYGLDCGLVQEGDPADFVMVKDLKDFEVEATYIGGQLVAEKGETKLDSVQAEPVNFFKREPIATKDIAIKAKTNWVQAIKPADGALVTQGEKNRIYKEKGYAYSNVQEDVLKLVNINRYQSSAKPMVSFIKHFGLQQGAIASSVAHDSHNVLAAGVEDDAIVKAANLVIENKGGIAVATQNEVKSLPLPVAGLMSTEDGFSVAEQYEQLDQKAKSLGSTLSAPFMTLSFMALLVIPELKISDEGLFDSTISDFTDVFMKE